MEEISRLPLIVIAIALWSKIEKNIDKIAIQSFTVPKARERGSERVSAAEGASEASSPEQENE